MGNGPGPAPENLESRLLLSVWKESDYANAF